MYLLALLAISLMQSPYVLVTLLLMHLSHQGGTAPAVRQGNANCNAANLHEHLTKFRGDSLPSMKLTDHKAGMNTKATSKPQYFFPGVKRTYARDEAVKLSFLD